MKKKVINRGELIIYRSSKGPEIEVKLDKETVWLTQAQIALLFGTKRPAITKHLSNIFKSGELSKNSVSSILEHTASDGKKYKTQFYSLDAVISIGYRVNSQRATHFRIWATKVLKQYLLQGYVLNEKRLAEAQSKFKDLQQTILFLQEKSRQELLSGQEKEILNLLSDYSKTLSILEKYDKDSLHTTKGTKNRFKLQYEEAKKVISYVKDEVLKNKEGSQIFGQEYDKKLAGIIGNVYQTYSRKELYKTIESKAAHLLYFIIKDHPFADGNKRIGSFLFVYFLDKNDYLYRSTGEKKINDNALTALALLIAVSDPVEKDKMINMISHLLS